MGLLLACLLAPSAFAEKKAEKDKKNDPGSGSSSEDFLDLPECVEVGDFRGDLLTQEKGCCVEVNGHERQYCRRFNKTG